MRLLQEGVIGDSLIEWATFAVLVVAYPAAYWRTHNCHVQRCWRVQWHAHPGHGHPVCKKHHPHYPLKEPNRVPDPLR